MNSFKLIFAFNKKLFSYSNKEIEIKQKLLKMTQVNIQKYGWTNRSIAQSAVDLNFSPSIANGIFSNGIIDVIYLSIEEWNKELEDNINKNKSKMSIDNILTHNHIKDSIQSRLLLQSHFNNNWNQAVKIGMKPENLAETITHLWRMVNVITVNHPLIPFVYKLLILKIYIGTEFYMLTDKSPNYDQTFKILDQMLSFNLRILKTGSIVSNNRLISKV